MEKLNYLINYLLREKGNIKIERIPSKLEDKKRLYRSLCNIREPKQIDEEYIKIENMYLQEELKKAKIINADEIENIEKTVTNPKIENSNKICLWKGDITKLQIDAIVNAGNSQGLGCFIPCHNCIDNQIHSLAGISLRLECDTIMKQNNYYLHTGKAFITKGYNLPAKYVIHTVGPIVNNKVTEKEELQLVNCYTSSLELAIKNGIHTIAFTCISTGEFKFPKKKACELAILAVESFLKDNGANFEKIIFNVYGEEDYRIYEQTIRKC